MRRCSGTKQVFAMQTAPRAWQRTEDRLLSGSTCWICHITKHVSMPKSQNGNKEAKKPKKVHVPNPPGLPASLAPIVPNPLRPKKR